MKPTDDRDEPVEPVAEHDPRRAPCVMPRRVSLFPKVRARRLRRRRQR